MSEFAAPAFRDGYEALKAGKPRSDNPYSVPALRLSWAEGYAARAVEEADAAKVAAKE